MYQGPVASENTLDILYIVCKCCKFSSSAVPQQRDHLSVCQQWLWKHLSSCSSSFWPSSQPSALILPYFQSQRLSPGSQSSCNISASLVFPQLSCHLHDSLECFLSRNSIYSLCFNTANAFPLLEPLCLFSVNELSFSLYGYFLWRVCVCSAKTSQF